MKTTNVKFNEFLADFIHRLDDINKTKNDYDEKVQKIIIEAFGLKDFKSVSHVYVNPRDLHIAINSPLLSLLTVIPDDLITEGTAIFLEKIPSMKLDNIFTEPTFPKFIFPNNGYEIQGSLFGVNVSNASL